MRVEVLDGVERRRRWSNDEKMRVVEETLALGAKVSEVARRNGISASLVFTWRRQARTTESAAAVAPHFAPVRIAATETGAEIPKPPSEDFARGSWPSSVARNGLIEISLGGGRRVRVDASVDADALARVIDVLERR